MKKIFIALIVSISLTLSSCDTYAQAYSYDDGFLYDYSYNNYPVRYINSLPYYYCMTNNTWQWIIVPRVHYQMIVHHPRPLRYARPHHFHVQPHRHYQPHNGIVRPHQPGNMHRPSPGGHHYSGQGHFSRGR